MGVCFACIGLLDGIVPPVDLLRREGGLVALGTDSASSNNCITLFNKIKSRSRDVIPASEALRMGTIEGARAIGLSKSIGVLAHGKQADLILVGLSELNPSLVMQEPIRNIVANLVYATTGHEVDSVIVAGRFLMHARRILAVDEEDVRREAQEAAEEVSRRVLADPRRKELALFDAMRDGTL